MGSKESSFKHRGIAKKNYRKAKANGKGEDYRWKKQKKEKTFNKHHPQETGDSIQSTEPLIKNADDHQEKETKSSIKKRQLQAKRKRRERHDQYRADSNRLLREAPHQYLWDQYVEWSGLKADDKKPWTKEQILSCVASDEEKLLNQVKNIIGFDYATNYSKKTWKDTAPGVGCIALASAAGRAVNLAPKLYDGRPVGKLFGKHIKIDEQKEWLRVCREKLGITPTAVGTAKRIQRLVDEGDLSLKATSVLMVDFTRDSRLRNILDMDGTKQELFELIEKLIEPLIRSNSLKILLYVPAPDDPTRMDQVVGKGALTPMNDE